MMICNNELIKAKNFEIVLNHNIKNYIIATKSCEGKTRLVKSIRKLMKTVRVIEDIEINFNLLNYQNFDNYTHIIFDDCTFPEPKNISEYIKLKEWFYKDNRIHIIIGRDLELAGAQYMDFIENKNSILIQPTLNLKYPKSEIRDIIEKRIIKDYNHDTTNHFG